MSFADVTELFDSSTDLRQEASKMYSFKRDFYYDVESALNAKTPVTALIGPRKCGKTVCLHQIEQSFTGAVYYDVKRLTDDERVTLKNNVCSSIRNNEKIIYLIDEVTYWMYPDSIIELFADMYSETQNQNTKLVLAGSQSRALECWCRRSFAGNANFIRMSFLDYSEWLRYTEKSASVESYDQFLFEIDDFYGMDSLQDYLQGCLDETVVSNSKASEIVINNDCDLISVSLLLDVLYIVLVSRHNRINAKTFTDEELLQSDIRYFFQEAYSYEVIERTEIFLLQRYKALKGANLQAIRQAMCFLYNCGLISITYTVSSLNHEINAHDMLFNDSIFEREVQSKTAFFRRFNFSIRHPMFYIAVLKLMLLDDIPKQLPKDLLGSLVKCHIRGLMPEAYSCEYHDDNDNEVDYLNQSYGVAIEVTVSDKKMNRTHFDCVSECPLKILTTKTQLESQGSVYRIPYFIFIEFISRRYKYIPDLWGLINSLFE